MSRILVPSRFISKPTEDGALIGLVSGRIDEHGHLIERVTDRIKLGPNMVHAAIIRPDGSVDDLGISHNLLTNAGRDLWAAGLGHAPGEQGALTGSSATSATKTAAGWTTDAWKGWRVYVPVTGLTTPAVYGNIGSNSSTVLTVDQWWTATDGVGTTPSTTAGYLILPSNVFRFIGLTADASAAAAGNTTLASEITTGGAARALATYAHTAATATYTLQKAFSITSTFTNIHRIGVFTAKDTTSGGVMGFESVLNQDATVGNGDTLTVTETVTMSG